MQGFSSGTVIVVQNSSVYDRSQVRYSCEILFLVVFFSFLSKSKF